MNAEMEKRLTRLYNRRMGESVLPLRIRQMGHGIWRVVDLETGSWIEAELRGSRLHRTAELDNA